MRFRIPDPLPPQKNKGCHDGGTEEQAEQAKSFDPTERYVTSPPGSTAHRLKAWESGFDNLVLAGDWIYTGINVGSVEGTVMSGRLAAHAVAGTPALEQIAGYPLPGRPSG